MINTSERVLFYLKDYIFSRFNVKYRVHVQVVPEKLRRGFRFGFPKQESDNFTIWTLECRKKIILNPLNF